MKTSFPISIPAVLICATVSLPAAIVDFDDLDLAPETSWSGPDPDGDVGPGPFGSTQTTGSFESGGVSFRNLHYDFGGSQGWSGFAYSNITDNTTPGFGNQYSAFPGTGHGPGTDNYGIGFGSGDVDTFDPSNAADLWSLPSFTLAAGSVVTGAYVTNTTYTALSMLEGDQFTQKFGGETGNDPDWLKLTAYGIDALGVPMATAVEFYLADYRFADNLLDYIVDDWTFLDLSPLTGAKSIHFNMTSSDIGDLGMNTPAYFAIDDLQVTPAAVPEPSSLVLLGSLAAAAGAMHHRRRRRAPLRQR